MTVPLVIERLVADAELLRRKRFDGMALDLDAAVTLWFAEHPEEAARGHVFPRPFSDDELVPGGYSAPSGASVAMVLSALLGFCVGVVAMALVWTLTVVPLP